MAVLAPPDWYPPRDPAMDVPSSSSKSSTVPRQRSSPATDSTATTAQSPTSLSNSLPQQPYPYPIQQTQSGWTPSISARPFYPAFYQNHHPHQQQAYALHPQLNHSHQNQAHISSQLPFFDQNNPQFAQWAYQRMMFNAQQGFPHISPLPQRSTQNGSNEYFSQPAFNPFPSGTPPPPNFPTSGNRSGDNQPSPSQYNGFHPYRRPPRQSSHASEGSDWRPPTHPQPPYAHRDASGSTSSLNSGSSHGHNNTASSRQRTNSAQSAKSSNTSPSPHPTVPASLRSRNALPQATPATGAHGRTTSGTSSSSSSVAPSPSSPVQGIPHTRNLSSSTAGSAPPRTSNVSVTSTTSAPVARPVRPSPLSQGTFTAAEKRMSRDDSELDPVPTSAMIRSGGLKGRLRRALSFNSASTLREVDDDGADDDDDASIKASSSKPKINIKSSVSSSSNNSLRIPDGTDEPPTPTAQQKKKSRAASLFNARFNASTDNISLSSTVSSASVMIRRLGKLARRNSLAGITSLFKDKKDKEDTTGDSKSKKKRNGKGEASEASVSHVTAELDRLNSGDWSASELSGLSPAAKLARQHTLKSNAEAAARARAQLETSPRGANGAGTPTTWEKNTTTRQASPIKRGPIARVSEDGSRVLVEDEDSASDDGSGDDHYGEQNHHPLGDRNAHHDIWDEDDDWAEGEDDEDVTIRVGFERTSLDDDEEETISWAVNVRRSIERTKIPSKGILKVDAGNYNQQAYLAQPIPTRARSNSYSSHPGTVAELGPLARIPSPDPDHIDGLHRHSSHSSSHSLHTSGPAPILPPLSFELSSGLDLDSPKKFEIPQASSPETGGHIPPPVPEKSLFNHPSYNSSAPALSTMLSNGPPTLTHRSATAPIKRLTFATNLSVYDTFSPTMYDRRSEPATWSRLTPALAQQIKEELNSYKMEEMEVHAASRIHTQFFV